MRPDDLLAQLKAAANPRKQRNLDIIHAVCREQLDRGSKDFSVATISRIALDRGGPARSTIHNKTGDDFKALIKAWATHTGGVTRKVRTTSDNPISSVLEKIEDPAVRAVMGAVLAENKKLKREINVLKATANVTIDMRQGFSSMAASSPSKQGQPVQIGLTAYEREALIHAISEQSLRDQGWKIDDYQRIITSTGRTIQKPGFVSALQKILMSTPALATTASPVIADSSEPLHQLSGRS